MTTPDLAGKVALVTGASRGAGRGIARALGDAGATVYVTGRSVRGEPTTDAMPGTIDETADEVTARGGRGIAVRCDHTDDDEVAALFERLGQEHERLDLLVNSAWGGNEIAIGMTPFWEQPIGHWRGMFEAGVRAALVASQMAVPLLPPGGLIVHISFWDEGKYTQNLFYDAAKATINRLAYGMSLELRTRDVAVVALSPGFMRTERVMAVYGGDLSATETPEYVGRAVAALAADRQVMAKSGKILRAGELAREYGFTDVDGHQPAPFVLPEV